MRYFKFKNSKDEEIAAVDLYAICSVEKMPLQDAIAVNSYHGGGSLFITIENEIDRDKEFLRLMTELEKIEDESSELEYVFEMPGGKLN